MVFLCSVALFNRRNLPGIVAFRSSVMGRKAMLFGNKKIRFWRTHGLRTEISPWTTADLFWFGDELVIIRVQRFILPIHHPPVVITSIDLERGSFPAAFETHRPSSVRFSGRSHGLLHIRLTDKVKETGSIDITVYDLSSEEVAELSSMKTWVENRSTG